MGKPRRVYTAKLPFNTFVGQRLGECLAFTETAAGTFEKTKQALLQDIDQQLYDEWLETINEQADELKRLADAGQQLAPALTASAAAARLLQDFRDQYIMDEWTSLNKAYEYTSLLCGGAIARFSMLWGAGHSLDDSDLTATAGDSRTFYREILELIEDYMQTAGKERART